MSRPTGSGVPNRRQEPRTALKGREGLLRGCFPVRLLDISPGGLRLETRAALRPGSNYELAVDLDGRRVSVRVFVRRCAAWGTRPDENGSEVLFYRAGASFVGLDDTQRGSLRSLLGRFEDGEASGSTRVAPPAALEPSRDAARRGWTLQGGLAHG